MANRFKLPEIRRSTVWTFVIFCGIPLGFFYFSNSCSKDVQKAIEPLLRTKWDEISNTGVEKKIDLQPLFAENVSHVCIQTPYTMSNEIASTASVSVASVSSLRIPSADEGETLLIVVFANGYRRFC